MYKLKLQQYACVDVQSESRVIATLNVEMGQVIMAACNLWKQLFENHCKMGQKAYRQKLLLFYCKKCPRSPSSSYKSCEKDMKISILFIFFLLLFPSFPSITTRRTRTFYTPNENSPDVDVPFLTYSCVQATSGELCLKTCIVNTFLATILCIQRTV